MPVKVRHSANPISEFILSRGLPPVQIQVGSRTESHIRVSAEHFHLVVLRRCWKQRHKQNSKQQPYYSHHENLLLIIFCGCQGPSETLGSSRNFMPQAGRWEIWRRRIGLVVGRTGGSLSSSGQKHPIPFTRNCLPKPLT